MKNTRMTICFVVIVLSVLTVYSSATTLTDNFDNGLSANWRTFQTDAANAPWTISANTGVLEISKPADNDTQTKYHNLGAGITSKFSLDGDFALSVDFTLVNFPLANTNGWNEAILQIANATQTFECLRFTSHYAQFAEKRWGSYLTYSCSFITGKLGITRQNNTVSAWISNGTNTIQLGSSQSDEFLGATTVNLFLFEESDHASTGRLSTALDVQFDNFTATADSIVVPEPTTLFMLGLGGLILRKRKL